VGDVTGWWNSSAMRGIGPSVIGSITWISDGSAPGLPEATIETRSAGVVPDSSKTSSRNGLTCW